MTDSRSSWRPRDSLGTRLRDGLATNRRRLLVGAGAAGGLLLAWEFLPRGHTAPLAPGPGQTALGAWLLIGTDSVVTVAVPQLEMGQGITTLLPQIVAAELGADFRQMAVQPAPVSEIWDNAPLAARWAELWLPFATAFAPDDGIDPQGWPARHWAQRHRFMATADGTSLDAYEAPARAAAASARAMLAQAAGQRWGVDWRQIEVAGGLITHGQHSASFGELAGAAAGFAPPDPPILNPAPVAEPPAGVVPDALPAFPRLDIPAKLDGSFPFAGDVRLPGMKFAAIRQAPIGDATLGDYDAGPGQAVPGFRRLVSGPDWLAAVADNWWAADQALARIAPRFRVSRPADTLAIEAALNAALNGGGTTIHAHGDIAGALGGGAGSGPMFSQRYDVASALHAGIETATATAHYRKTGWFGHRLDLWVASQAPEQTRVAVADALGMAVENVILMPVSAGGSFDARLETPQAVQAALIAREIDAPVQLMWSRWQEQIGGVMRPPVAAQMAARVDASGAIAGWRARLALPASGREFGARVFGGQRRARAMAKAGDHADPLVVEGAVPPYAIGALAVEHIPVAVGIPTGRLRGNAHGYAAFFTESFIDEIAVARKREPLGFRMALLAEDQRLAQCLQRVSTIAGWNGGADGSGNGLACHRIGSVDSGGCIAAIATARREANGVRVDRIFAVADIGRIVNLDIARQQIEGGLIFGIGLALGSSTGFAGGLPENARLSQMALPTLGDCPEVQVELMTSEAPAFDPGELGVCVVAPAIANALASATGLRFRKLPLVPEED